MDMGDLFVLGNLLDKYIGTLDVSSAEYEHAVMVNSDICFYLSDQVKEISKCKRNNTSRL